MEAPYGQGDPGQMNHFGNFNGNGSAGQSYQILPGGPAPRPGAWPGMSWPLPLPSSFGNSPQGVVPFNNNNNLGGYGGSGGGMWGANGVFFHNPPPPTQNWQAAAAAAAVWGWQAAASSQVTHEHHPSTGKQEEWCEIVQNADCNKSLSAQGLLGPATRSFQFPPSQMVSSGNVNPFSQSVPPLLPPPLPPLLPPPLPPPLPPRPPEPPNEPEPLPPGTEESGGGVGDDGDDHYNEGKEKSLSPPACSTKLLSSTLTHLLESNLESMSEDSALGALFLHQNIMPSQDVTCPFKCIKDKLSQSQTSNHTDKDKCSSYWDDSRNGKLRENSSLEKINSTGEKWNGKSSTSIIEVTANESPTSSSNFNNVVVDRSRNSFANVLDNNNASHHHHLPFNSKCGEADKENASPSHLGIVGISNSHIDERSKKADESNMDDRSDDDGENPLLCRETLDELEDEDEVDNLDQMDCEIPDGLDLPLEILRDLRHGRVQSIKILDNPGGSLSGGNGGRSGKSATVAFIDIRSAAKAFRAVHSMAGQPLDIGYHEPGSAPPRCHPPMDPHPSTEAPSDIPVVIGQGSTSNNVGPPNQSPGIHNNSIPGPSMYRQQRFPLQHGQSEESSSHFYDQPKGFSRGRGDHGYRGRRENRHNNYNRHFHNRHMSWGYSNESRVAPPAPPVESNPPVTSEGTSPSRHIPSKRHTKSSSDGSSERGSTAGSRTRSSRSSSSVSSGRSPGRSPPHHSSSNHFSRGGSGSGRFHQNNSYSRQRYRRNRPRHSSRSPAAASPSSSSSSSSPGRRKTAAVLSPSHSPSSDSRGASTTSHHHHQHHRRPPNTAELHAAIKIRNLPLRSSASSIKDGLYHLFKQFGKIAWVRVISNGDGRREAVVCFKSKEFATKALQNSQGMQFFGNKVQVSLYYTGKGEECGMDEESRVEEESSFPTRSVLVSFPTSLDSVTVSELKSVFDQYGDIVNIDIRKQGTSTHAVCEFLDIASAIRAKWGRHVFKSTEARISFFRNPITNALLLDGTANVTEQQVKSKCCQYGAIKVVDMDAERCLALVQYEEISSAETAIRELGNWAIKGKKLDIDFASEYVIKKFKERLDLGLGNSSLSVDSSSPSSNPLAAITAGTFKETSVRKARSRLGEYLGDDDSLKSGYHNAYRNDLDADSKPMTTLKSMVESSPPSNLNAGRIHESTVQLQGYRGLEGQRSTMGCTKSNGSVKIDLNCHETDSAIVTSSSDIIAVENSDTDVHSNFTGSSTSGDEKVGSFEPAIKHRKSSSENVSNVLTTTTVDGVSSTSPEPKTEIVSTTELGIGTESVARYLNDSVATDSQKRLLDSKIRRTSADSGNHLNSSPECHALHSNQEPEKVPISQLGKGKEKGNPSTLSNSQRIDEGDDRPGTPLCDENPEGFDAGAPSQKSTSTAASVPPSRKSSSKSEPASIQETSKHKTVKSQSTVSPKDTKSSGGSGNGISQSVKKLVVSPTVSPSSVASSSVMLSSTNDTSIFSPNTESSEAPAYSKSSTNSVEILNTSSNFCVAEEALVKRDSSDDISNGAVSCEPNNAEQGVSSEPVKSGVVEKDEFASSDSEGGLSPRHSPTADLDQRVRNLCERYDTWDGNRKIYNKSTNATTNQDTNSGGGNTSDSIIDKIKETIPNFSGTSDIVRTVLARKSIFDEDCERLVNFNEKYETKPTALITTSTNWKLPTLTRTPSCSSNSAVPYLSQTSPLAVNSNCVPPLSSPVNSISPIASSGNGNFNSTTLPSTSTKSSIVPPCATSPGYSSPSLSSAIIGKSISEKVKDLNANVAPQLNRSLSSSSATSSSSLSSVGLLPVNKSFGIPPGPSTPTGSITSGTPITPVTPAPSTSTKSFSSFQSTSSPSLPPVKPSIDLTLASAATPKIPKNSDMKKMPPVHPLTIGIGNTLTPTNPSVSHAFTPGTSTGSSPTPVQSNSFPRSVERSLSVESRKSSPGVSTPGFQANFSSTSASSSYSTESFGSTDSARPLTPRRISVDTASSSGSSSVSTDSNVVTSKQSLPFAGSTDKPAELSGKSEVTRTEKFGNVYVSSDMKHGSTEMPNPSQPHHHHQQLSIREKVQTKDILTSNTSGSSSSSKSMNSNSHGQSSSKKNEFGSLKDEISSKVLPIHQETTVAVVASVQTPLLTSRNEMINTSKESSKKDKDKKRRSSGNSTPVSSGGGSGSANHGHQHQSGSSNIKCESHSNQGSSTSSSKSSSSKDKEERKERKESKSSSSSNSVEPGKDKNEDSHHGSGSSSSHHKKDKRDKEKDHRDNSADRTSFPNISKDSHSHKRDKDNKDSGKAKRRLSSQENDQDRKKVKVEKEASQPDATGHHHHRSKGSESKDPRESTKESTTSTKDKLSSKESSSKPEKVSSGSSSASCGNSSVGTKDQSSTFTVQNASSSEPRKEKSDGKEKERDHHHKSKSSSSSSSSSKHHSHHQLQKSSRSSMEGHSSSSSTHKQDSTSTSKDPHRKDKDKEKSSTGKENSSSSGSKSASKHHSHTSHSSSSSISKSKDVSSSSTSSKNKSSRKDRDRPKQDRTLSSLDSDDDNDGHNQTPSLLGVTSDVIKSERSEKRDSESKRDRHKSGGGDSGVGGGDSEKMKNRKKEKEAKKRRRVIEDSATTDTDDEEEEKKHHSIFDVVIDYSDYYVSMYDKVKRSNRACKNITAQQKQQEEEQKRKQDKVADSFKQLKQSRAKREEKKRSTSIEERKSMSNSSSDEGSHMETMNDTMNESMNDFDDGLEHHRKRATSEHRDHQSEKGHSSDDDDRKSKSKRKMKSKSSRKDEDKERKKAKRSNKSPSRPSMYNSSTLFSHSDDDSPASSSHPPEQKKKKISSSGSSLGRHQIGSLGSSNNMSFSGSTKSSDESHSESENASERKKISTSSSLSSKSKTFVSFSDQIPNHQSKYNSQNIYSDSDTSDVDQHPPQHQHPSNSLHKTPIPSVSHSSSTSTPHRTKNKEKSSKQKNRKQSLFDSTDSSDNEESSTAPPNPLREKKSKEGKDKESTRSSKSRDRDKENKSKKKHRGHKSSSLKSRKQYYITADGSGDQASHGSDKRDAAGGTATMEELFGPMTSSSDSEDIPKESDHERPKTPTVVMTTPSSCEDITLVKKSSKSSRHHRDKSPFAVSSTRTDSLSIDEHTEVGSTHSTPTVSSIVPKEKSSEKKKKKHHKEKRSKRGSTHEGTPLSSQSSFGKQDSVSSKSKQDSVDYDALFNSPAASPSSELKIVENDYPIPTVPSNTTTIKASSLSPIAARIERIHAPVAPEIEIRAPTPQLLPVVVKPITDRVLDIDECEKEMRGMFSSDDDDDDDKLKITDAITDAIRASADEQDTEPSPTKEIDTEWKRKEEEEQKLNSLVEQDKAIESIVLLDRKSPTPLSSNPEEEVIKEEIPKDSTTISQEETDVAVATILETLGNEEKDEPLALEGKPLLIGPVVPPVPLHSPPTLRIIEGVPQKPIVETSESNDEIESAIAAIPPRDGSGDSNSEKEESRDEPDPWGFDDNRSPKELQIDEGDTEETHDEEEVVETPVVVKREISEERVVPIPSRSPEKVQPVSFEEVSVDASEAKTKVDEIKVEAVLEPVLPPKISPRATIKVERRASKASDVYEFHDSDDDKRQEKAHLSHTRHTPPMISPPAKSPVAPPPICVPLPDSKLQSPPISVPMPILQPQQPPPPPVVVHVEPEKPRTVLHPVVLPPQSSPTVLATPPPPPISSTIPPPPPVVIQPTKSIPLVQPPPPPVVIPSLPPPPPPISSVPCTPIAITSAQKSPPVTSIPVITHSPIIQSSMPPIVQPPPPPVSKSTPPPPPVSKHTPPPPPVIVTKSTPPPPPVTVTKSTPPPPPVTKSTPPPPPVSKTTPPPPPISKSTPPPPQVVATRSTIDEAIDEVIRKLHSGDPLTFTESPLPAPLITQPAQRAGRRSRSRSKDSPDENASVPRVQNRPDPHRQGAGQVLGVIGGHQMDTPPAPRIKPPTPLVDMEGNKTPKDNKIKEGLIDAHAGMITPMVQEEGRYLPILSQASESQIRLPQPNLHQMPQQMQGPNRPTPVISRMVDRESPVRPSVVEKHPAPLLPHQQIPISKHEGLTAMLAQQQQQQLVAQQQHLAHQQQQQQLAAHHQQQQHQFAAQHQQQMAAQHQQQMLHRKPTEPAPYGFQPQSSPLRPPMSLASAAPQPPQQSIPQPAPMQQHSGPPSGGSIIRPVSTAYGMSQQSHHAKPTTVVSSGGPNLSPTGIPVSVQHGIPTSPFMPNIHPPVSRGVFVSRANSPGAMYQHQQQQILQMTTNKPQERQSPRPSSRHTPGPLPTIPISQAGKPELVHLPEIPMATTVTKINAGEEQQQRKSAIMPPMPNVVLTSTSGPVMSGPPFLIKTVVSSPSQIQMAPSQMQMAPSQIQMTPSQIQMTQQQLQQHRTLQEAFRLSAEGSIRVPSNKEDAMELGPRPTEVMGLPQRVDIHGGSMLPPAHSPKPGRVPLPHEQLPAAHAGQPRIIHRPTYETPGDSSCVPLDLVTQSSNNNSISESKSSIGRNDNEHVMALTSHSISNHSHAQPTTSTLMARKVVPQADMRIMPGHGRLGSDTPHYISAQSEHPPSFSTHYMSANPNMPNHPMGHQGAPPFGMRHEKPGMQMDPKISIPEQNKGPSMIAVVDRPISHTVPPHLSSPHGNDQRGTDSPSVGAVFPGQRQHYLTSGLPQQQQPSSQAISNMYAEIDGRPFAHSPSYIYDSRAISVAAAAAAAMEQERERPKGTSSPLDPPYRIRSPPSHGLSSGEAGLQGDSLLQLLQRYPIMWQGLLALKNDSAAVQMHFVSGSMAVARESLPSNPDGSIPPLRISQRMRLEQNQLEGVARKLQINAEHCMLLALPCGRDHMDVLHQSNNLRQGFITYLQLKQAAGIVNICHPDTQQAAFVIHIFPSCDFANENLAKIAPDLLSGVADIAHLLIVIATV